MGGVVTVLAGDARQVLPVLPFKHLDEVKSRVIKCVPWWTEVQYPVCIYAIIPTVQVDVLRLSMNYRVKRAYGRDKVGADTWAEYLLDVGNGVVPLLQGGPGEEERTPCIDVPGDMQVDTVAELIEFVFGDGHDFARMAGRAILSPFHTQADLINAQLMARLPGDRTSDDPALNSLHTVYYSRDEYVHPSESRP